MQIQEKTILIVSDTHKDINNLKIAINQVNPDIIFHLGDHDYDTETILTDAVVYNVSGNCDLFSKNPSETVVDILNKRILICHGHSYGVKSTINNLYISAKQKNIDICCYGHTHIPSLEIINSIYFINPGSLKGNRGTYCVLKLVESSNPTIKFFDIDS